MEPIDTQLFGTVHRKQKINSKRKGNINELTATKVLTEWVGTEFVRVPRSGGIRWKNRADVCGDVINNDPSFKFPFSVETKHVKNLGINPDKLDLRRNSVIYRYWAQCNRDACAANKTPILMIRDNGMKTGTYYIFIYLSYKQAFMLAPLNIYVQGFRVCEMAFGIFGYKSEDFFKSVSYETLKNIYNG
jgi:hypothetical protein